MHSPDIPPRSSGVVFCFDLDGTICTNVENSRYEEAEPDNIVIQEINRQYDMGNIIKIMTARGSVSKIDHTELTKGQLMQWGVKYHELIMNKKPYADIFIDDRGMHIDDWKKSIPLTRGIVAGSFDLIHPGYIKMFSDAKRNCTHLTVALHANPFHKEPLIHSLNDRLFILSAIKYIDEIIIYESEHDLENILSTGKFDIRFLGDDYLNKKYTGSSLDIKIFWIDRSHGRSTTLLKEFICRRMNEQGTNN